MAKKLLLTLSDGIYAELQKRQQAQFYNTMQEMISEFIRKGLFGSQKPAEQPVIKTGRPKKVELEDIYTNEPQPGQKPKMLWKGKPF